MQEENPELKKVQELEAELYKISSGLDNTKAVLYKNSGKKITGTFGQVVTTENGDVEMTYSKFVEGFPVIQNTQYKAYYTVGGERREEPKVLGTSDILSLIVDSKQQTCADTQVEVRALYELEQLKSGSVDKADFDLGGGNIVEYKSDGTYTTFDGNKIVKRSYEGQVGENFEDWLENVQVFTNTGTLRSTLTPVSIDNVKPGDVITIHPDPVTGYGHTMGIKEILEIEVEPGVNKRFFRSFAGSDPAIDAKIYPDLISEDKLRFQLQTGEAQVSAWREEQPAQLAAAK